MAKWLRRSLLFLLASVLVLFSVPGAFGQAPGREYWISEVELQELETALSEAQAALKKSQAELSEARTRLTILSAELSAAKTLAATLQVELASLKGVSSVQVNDLDTLKKSWSEFENEVTVQRVGLISALVVVSGVLIWREVTR